MKHSQLTQRKQSLGIQLRRARLGMFLTQVDIASADQVSLTSIESVEAGDLNYGINTLMILADSLGMELALVPKGSTPQESRKLIKASDLAVGMRFQFLRSKQPDILICAKVEVREWNSTVYVRYRNSRTGHLCTHHTLAIDRQLWEYATETAFAPINLPKHSETFHFESLSIPTDGKD